MYYSQFGEDKILARIFSGQGSWACVEVGANNGEYGSTTLFFERRGWECVLVEPNPDLCQELRSKRNAKIFECAVSGGSGVATLQIAVGGRLAHQVSSLGDENTAAAIKKTFGFATVGISVPTRTLDEILEEASLTSPIGFVSIDVEGHEVEVLKGFTVERWRPRVLIVEDNGQEWVDEVSRQLSERGYVRFMRTGVNDWYAEHTDKRLATVCKRLGYWPSMIVARSLVAALRLADRARRLPGGRTLWIWLGKGD